MGHSTRFSPAPLACGSKRPRRSTTPRSHSLMMYNEFQNQISTIPTMTAIPTKPISIISIPPQDTRFLLRRRASHFYRLDVKLQPFDLGHLDRLAFRHWLRRDGAPQFAVDTDQSFGIRLQLLGNRAGGSDQLFPSCGCFPFSRTQYQAHQHHRENTKRQRSRQRDSQADTAGGQRRANQEQRAQEHRNNATERQDAVAWRFGFEDEEGQG